MQTSLKSPALLIAPRPNTTELILEIPPVKLFLESWILKFTNLACLSNMEEITRYDKNNKTLNVAPFKVRIIPSLDHSHQQL